MGCRVHSLGLQAIVPPPVPPQSQAHVQPPAQAGADTPAEPLQFGTNLPPVEAPAAAPASTEQLSRHDSSSNTANLADAHTQTVPDDDDMFEMDEVSH